MRIVRRKLRLQPTIVPRHVHKLFAVANFNNTNLNILDLENK